MLIEHHKHRAEKTRHSKHRVSLCTSLFCLCASLCNLFQYAPGQINRPAKIACHLAPSAAAVSTPLSPSTTAGGAPGTPGGRRIPACASLYQPGQPWGIGTSRDRAALGSPQNSRKFCTSFVKTSHTSPYMNLYPSIIAQEQPWTKWPGCLFCVILQR